MDIYRQRLAPSSGEYHLVPVARSDGDVVAFQTDAYGKLLVTATIAAGGTVPVAALPTTTIAVLTTPTPLAALSASRTLLAITNNGPDPFYYSQDAALVSGAAASIHGGRILLRGQTVIWSADDPEGRALAGAAWYGICAAATTAFAAVGLGT